MKKIAIALIVLSFAVPVGLIVGKYFSNLKEKEVAEEISQNYKTNPGTSGKFVWGVQGGAYYLNSVGGSYNPQNVEAQLKAAQESGINLIRANLEIVTDKVPFIIEYNDADNDDFINRVTSKGFDLLLVLDPNVPQTVGLAQYQQEEYKLGSYAAKRYKGKVKYYQAANEVSGTSARLPEDKGQSFKDSLGNEYDLERYNAVLAWVKGISQGIRENDPSAQIVVSGHYILYPLVERMVREGADFDILGWAFYSQDGSNVTRREYNYGNYMNLAERLYKIKKNLWIIEANYEKGSYDKNKGSTSETEKRQAEYIKTLAENVYKSGYFKGFLVYTLLDNPTNADLGNPQDAHLGLVEVKKRDGLNKITKYKEAFFAYRDFIRLNRALPTLK